MAKTKTWEWTSFWSNPDFNNLLGVAHGKAGKAYEGWYLSEYLGFIDLPKKFGRQQVYHLIPA